METASSGSVDGGERRGSGLVEVHAAAASLRRSEVFHVVKEILGFVLYMHHQIPSWMKPHRIGFFYGFIHQVKEVKSFLVLQNLENEFASLKEEMTEMALPPAELKPSEQRKYNTRKREVRRRIKKQEKLMTSISSLLIALQQALDEVRNIEGVVLILGGSLVRPLFVYDITISHGSFDSGSAKDALTKLAQSVSRKSYPFSCIKWRWESILHRPYQVVSAGEMSEYIELTPGFPAKA
ncbi:hypothetical protein ACP4OV_010443 [Aristida adscensionis]